jgi:cytochrome P450 family 2 subfamily U polypeptide 1
MHPQDTNIMANLIAIHYDPALWPDPHSFRPERFLSPDGLKVAHSDFLMPFSVGKRECLGKTLAEKEFFLFFAGLAHRFRFDPAEGAPLPSTDPKDDTSLGIVRTAPTFFMKITKRT